jgi:hypothetical protein
VIRVASRRRRRTALGGPLVGTLGAAKTLAASGTGSVLLAAAAAVLWRSECAHPNLGPKRPGPAGTVSGKKDGRFP